MKDINIKKALKSYREVERLCKMISSQEDYIQKYDYNKPYNEKLLADYRQRLRDQNAELEALLIPIDSAIKDQEGRASARTITAKAVLRYITEVEDKLMIAKAAMDGIEVDVDINAQDFPSAYKWTPESTHIKALYKRDHWVITYIYRSQCRRRSQEVVCHLTDAAKEAIINRHSVFSL